MVAALGLLPFFWMDSDLAGPVASVLDTPVIASSVFLDVLLHRHVCGELLHLLDCVCHSGLGDEFAAWSGLD